MARLVHAETGPEAYKKLANLLLTEGQPASPRRKPTLEIEDCTVLIDDAEQAVPFGTSRKVSLKIGCTEYAQLLAGVSWLEQLDAASGGNFSQFADDGRLAGAYGPRIYNQVAAAEQILRNDPDSRQAVVAITRGIARDGLPGQHDVPCTLSAQYRIRGQRLNATVIMRSSDFWLGIPYDWWMQSRLQMTLADALGLKAGSFTWMAGSQHLYTSNSAGAIEVSTCEIQDQEQPPAITNAGENGYMPVVAAQLKALEVVAGAKPWDDVMMWHEIHVPSVEGTWVVCAHCRYVVPADQESHGECEVCNGKERWRHG